MFHFYNYYAEYPLHTYQARLVWGVFYLVVV